MRCDMKIQVGGRGAIREHSGPATLEPVSLFGLLVDPSSCFWWTKVYRIVVAMVTVAVAVAEISEGRYVCCEGRCRIELKVARIEEAPDDMCAPASSVRNTRR